LRGKTHNGAFRGIFRGGFAQDNIGVKNSLPSQKSLEMPHYVFCPGQKKLSPALSESEVYETDRERERESERERERERTKVRAIIFLNRPAQNEKSANLYERAVQYVVN
jgi:hypothetical protein